MLKDKQLIIKPLDLLLAIKLVVNKDEDFGIARLADEFQVSVSTIHGSLARAEAARLLSRSSGSARGIRPSLQEFAISGVKYAFPAVIGRATRGVPTAIGAPILAQHFEATPDAIVPVWPHPEGKTFGFEVVPLHPSVPTVALKDAAFYEVLALVDAIRVGAARERELAIHELKAKL